MRCRGGESGGGGGGGEVSARRVMVSPRHKHTYLVAVGEADGGQGRRSVITSLSGAGSGDPVRQLGVRMDPDVRCDTAKSG